MATEFSRNPLAKLILCLGIGLIIALIWYLTKMGYIYFSWK